jgi:hypothetical protein
MAIDIVLGFEEDQLRRDAAEGRNLICSISFRFDEGHYPEQLWWDSAVVLLGMWMAETIKLARGENRVEFLFFEGPFRLVLSKVPDSNLLQVAAADSSQRDTVTVDAVVDMLADSTRALSSELSRLGIRREESSRLERLMSEMRLAAGT